MRWQTWSAPCAVYGSAKRSLVDSCRCHLCRNFLRRRMTVTAHSVAARRPRDVHCTLQFQSVVEFFLLPRRYFVSARVKCARIAGMMPILSRLVLCLSVLLLMSVLQALAAPAALLSE